MFLRIILAMATRYADELWDSWRWRLDISSSVFERMYDHREITCSCEFKMWAKAFEIFLNCYICSKKLRFEPGLFVKNNLHMRTETSEFFFKPEIFLEKMSATVEET